MSCHHFLVASLALGLFKLCTSNAIIDKQCPDPKVVESFDKHQFSGIWYHIQRYMDDNQAQVLQFMTCSTVTYTVIDDESIAINNTFKTPGRGKGQGYTTKLAAQAKIPNPNEPAKWIVYLQQGKDTSEYGSLADLDLNYRILETDYNNYALVWTCQTDRKQSLLDAMILSRKPTLDEKVLTDLHQKLADFQLDQKLFREVNQQDCQY